MTFYEIITNGWVWLCVSPILLITGLALAYHGLLRVSLAFVWSTYALLMSWTCFLVSCYRPL